MGTASGIVLDDTFRAAADYSACQYKGVQVSSDDTCAIPSAALLSGFLGVLQDKPGAAGRPGRVIMLGRTKAYIGQTLTIGQSVCCAASGFMSGATSGTAGVGFISRTANSGSVGEVVLTGMTARRAASYAP